MFTKQWNEQLWCPVGDWQRSTSVADKNMSAVLTVTSPLTRFVESRFNMKLSVQLHEQFLDRADDVEASLLGCEAADKVLRRRVSLLYRGKVMFDAESVLPLEGLPHTLMEALQAGERPLANLLLDQGLSLARSDLSIAQLNGEVCNGCMARRSVLRSAHGTRALVVEVFREEFWSRLKRVRGEFA
ncbi:MAG: chorismate lyase [Mariprofundaceae bacterium]